MLRLSLASIYSLFGYLLIGLIPVDLTIGQWVTFSLWFLVMTFTAVIGIVIFSSIWLRNGYAGLNKILEDHEVGKFVTHVLSFLCLLSLQALVATQPLITYVYNEALYYLFASGIVGSGVYGIAEKFGVASKIGSLLYKKPAEPTEDGRSNG